MAFTTGATGNLASTGSGNTHDLIDNGAPYQATLNLSADNFDVTRFGSIEALTKMAGLKSWTMDFAARFPGSAPQAGLNASVAFATGYVAGCNSYTLNITSALLETTAFGDDTWKTYTGNVYSWSGSFDVLVDDTNSLVDLTAEASEGASATFTFGAETTDDDSAAGNIITTQLSAVASVGDANRATYTFEGSGPLTFAGDNTLITAGTLGVPTANTSTTLTFASGKTAAGSTLWSSIGISVSAASLVDITGTLQGTGALAIA